MGDEGVGVHIARYMEGLSLPEAVTVLDGGTGNFQLLEPMQSADKIIIIDATVDGNRPGHVSVLHPKFTTDYPRTLTAHDIGLKDLLDAFHLLGDKPDVTLFAISIDESVDLDTDMSTHLASKIEEIGQRVYSELRKMSLA